MELYLYFMKNQDHSAFTKQNNKKYKLDLQQIGTLPVQTKLRLPNKICKPGLKVWDVDCPFQVMCQDFTLGFWTWDLEIGLVNYPYSSYDLVNLSE